MAFEPFEAFGDVEELAERLANADPSVRRLAALELGETASPEAVPLLAGAIGDADPAVRLAAARALSDFDGAAVASALGAGIRDPDPGVASAAADSLAELKDPPPPNLYCLWSATPTASFAPPRSAA